jgi:hypothetical protein
MFATGIENSIPTVKNGRVRVDQMDVCGHYERWREDFDLVEDMGIQFLRYGPPIYRTFLAPGRYDWEFTDLTFAELKRRDITPIVDLCHFGVPDWIGNFQNPDFAPAVRALRRRFRRALSLGAALHAGQRDVHLRRLSRQIWLVERAAEDRPRLRHRAQEHRQGNVLAMTEILKRRPTRSSSSRVSEYFHADSPAAIGPPSHELTPLPQPRSQLRPPRRQRDVRISAR